MTDVAPEPTPEEATEPAPEPVAEEPITSTSIDPDKPVSVSDGDPPAENMEDKTLNAKVLQMHMGFDVNGVSGVPGDYLAYTEGHWFILKDV